MATNSLGRRGPQRRGIALDPLIQSLLRDRRAAGRLRSLQPVQSQDATHVTIAGKALINFCSNNYLGLSQHPRVLAAVRSAVGQAGFGSGASALISGYTTHHASAERAIARWKGTESAVLLPSGYQANFAAVQTLAALATQGKPNRPVRFLVDKLVHASLLDAVMASGLPMRVFPHNHLAKLERLLAGGEPAGVDVVATESIFSMDGDAGDLPGLAKLKKKHPFIWLLDEAHASGVYGDHGAGLAAELGLSRAVDISVVTLSKALGGIGGAICASRAFCTGVVNFGRAAIYSTSLPACAAAAAEAAIGVLRDEPESRLQLRETARRVRAKLSAAGVAVLPGDSPIICVVLGSEEAALAAARGLREEGLLVVAVRPPTVAPGSSRLRVTLCSGHNAAEIEHLSAVLTRLCGRRRHPRRGRSSG
jgi:8-amino-7-oxononanoate synthase